MRVTQLVVASYVPPASLALLLVGGLLTVRCLCVDTPMLSQEPVKSHPRMRTTKTVYRTILDSIHFKKSDARRLAVRISDLPCLDP